MTVYMQTFTGKKIFLQNPTIRDIDIQDIAHGLSNTCRFAGQCDEFYSVAEHSMLVAKIASPEFALEALLHDASEAYIGDVTSPLKSILPAYKVIEDKLQNVVLHKFGLRDENHDAIKEIDLRILATERDVVFKDTILWGNLMDTLVPYDDVVFRFYSPRQAKIEFLAMFETLMEERGVRAV